MKENSRQISEREKALLYLQKVDVSTQESGKQDLCMEKEKSIILRKK